MKLYMLVPIIVVVFSITTVIYLKFLNGSYYCRRCAYKNSGACRTCKKDSDIKSNKYNTFMM